MTELDLPTLVANEPLEVAAMKAFQKQRYESALKLIPKGFEPSFSSKD